MHRSASRSAMPAAPRCRRPADTVIRAGSPRRCPTLHATSAPPAAIATTRADSLTTSHAPSDARCRATPVPRSTKSTYDTSSSVVRATLCRKEPARRLRSTATSVPTRTVVGPTGTGAPGAAMPLQTIRASPGGDSRASRHRPKVSRPCGAAVSKSFPVPGALRSSTRWGGTVTVRSSCAPSRIASWFAKSDPAAIAGPLPVSCRVPVSRATMLSPSSTVSAVIGTSALPTRRLVTRRRVCGTGTT